MPPVAIEETANHDVAIFERVLVSGKETLTPTMARFLLRLRFPDQDVARMNELAQRNQDGQLSPAESEELGSYVKVGHLVAILQSMARQTLKKKR